MYREKKILQQLYIIAFLFFVADSARIHQQSNPDINSCTLPKYPINGRWLVFDSKTSFAPGNKVSSGTIVNVGCNGQYKLTGSSLIECKSGTWSSQVGECLEICPPIINTLSTKVTCTFNGKPVDGCTNAVNGTVATFKCAPYYENSELNRNPFRFCQNGSWSSEIPTCTPICGVKPKASKKRKPFYPWNVAVFKVDGKKKLFRCAGTLINERIILTAAHCITDELATMYSVSQIMVAAGKSSSQYQDPQDQEAQYSDLENMFIPEEYKGSIRKYSNDIAVLVTKNNFNMTQRIQPICLDWSNKFLREFQYPKITGSIAGPFKSEYYPNLKQVIEIEIPFVNDTQCYDLLTSKELGEPNFESLYFEDKLCSNYINSDKAPGCRIDTGGGLVSKNPFDNKHYLTGIISVFPSIHGKVCDNKRWVLFTQVSKYMSNFIIEKNNMYTSISRSYFQTSCGVKSVQAQTLIVSGTNATKGDYPWQVAIYRIEGKTKQLICGGSLINQRLILTAAHCVTGLRGNTLSKELFVVAVGKYYRNFDDPRDTDAQFSTLKNIFVPENYQGELQNYLADIAVLITENSFTLTRAVEPVCVDWVGKYENQFLRPSVTGFVSGWGFTRENSEPSEELKDLEVPYIERDECEENLPSDYDIYLTSDKICSGFLNKSRAVCSGDSGGGLVFKNMNDGRYYIAGIVSLSPQAPTGGCDSQQYALYTKVAAYINDFVLEKVQLYWA